MKYHGGKNRTGKQIACFIVNECEKRQICPDGYAELFSGMMGVYKHIPKLFEKIEKKCNHKMEFIASDINESIIKMWKSLQSGWIPPRYMISEEQYDKLRKSKSSSALKGYVGHYYGWSGQYFGTFDAKLKTPSQVFNRPDKLIEVSNELKMVHFKTADYTKWRKLRNFVIYLDSPYEDVNSNYYQEGGIKRPKFDHKKYWEWVRKLSRNNLVFASAYKAPSDFTQVFEIKSKTPTTFRIEKLFIYE